jgi:hypothetical protein
MDVVSESLWGPAGARTAASRSGAGNAAGSPPGHSPPGNTMSPIAAPHPDAAAVAPGPHLVLLTASVEVVPEELGPGRVA